MGAETLGRPARAQTWHVPRAGRPGETGEAGAPWGCRPPSQCRASEPRYSPSVSREGSSKPLLPSSASARHPPCQASSVSWKLRAHGCLRPSAPLQGPVCTVPAHGPP